MSAARFSDISTFGEKGACLFYASIRASAVQSVGSLYGQQVARCQVPSPEYKCHDFDVRLGIIRIQEEGGNSFLSH